MQMLAQETQQSFIHSVVAQMQPGHRQVYKNKRIRKRAKQNSQYSKISDCESTSQESPDHKPEIIPILSPSECLKSVYMMIKDIIQKAKFGMDTYLASLKLLEIMSFKGNQKTCRVIAASIISIVGKVHEYRSPNYKQLTKWGKFCFSGSDILKTQAQILKGINFKVPLINNFSSQENLLSQIDNLQGYFCNI